MHQILGLACFVVSLLALLLWVGLAIFDIADWIDVLIVYVVLMVASPPLRRFIRSYF